MEASLTVPTIKLAEVNDHNVILSLTKMTTEDYKGKKKVQLEFLSNVLLEGTIYYNYYLTTYENQVGKLLLDDTELKEGNKYKVTAFDYTIRTSKTNGNKYFTPDVEWGSWYFGDRMKFYDYDALHEANNIPEKKIDLPAQFDIPDFPEGQAPVEKVGFKPKLDTNLPDLEIVYEKIQPLGEHNKPCDCAKTESFPYLDFKSQFSHFNPMQSKVLPYTTKVENLVLASPTASGKTTVIEMYVATTIARGHKALYLSPMKALSEEKYADWTDSKHPLSKYKVAIITGDYVLTDEKRKQLMDAHIIIATSEMLDSKTRTIKSESNKWLMEIGCLLVDEAHLLTSDSRGDRLETAIMRFTKENEKSVVVLLSATMPNVDELRVWLEKITKRASNLVTSDYRPCKLEVGYVEYVESDRYEVAENERMYRALEQINKFPSDQWLVFTGNKRWGRDFAMKMKANGYTCEFHNADCELAERRMFENDFKSGKIKILVSTTTLAWGCNLPARRVLIAHVKIGMNEMSVCDIVQMMGRSGRPRYDKLGNAYILIPSGDADYHKTRIQRGQNIISGLSNQETLYFHVVSEVNNKVIKDVQSLRDWHKRSLAYLQNKGLTDEEYTDTLEFLVSKKMIYDKGQGQYAIAPLGRVCAYMYFSPADVYAWYQNFNSVFKGDKPVDDYLTVWALVNIPTYDLYVSKAEQFEADLFDQEISLRGKFCNGGSAKYGSALYGTLQGVKRTALRSLQFMMKKDMERVLEAVGMIDAQFARWHKTEFFKELSLRIKYEIPAEYVQLVRVGGIGRVYAERLYKKGIKTIHDVTTHKETVLEVMGPARGEVAYASALQLREVKK